MVAGWIECSVTGIVSSPSSIQRTPNLTVTEFVSDPDAAPSPSRRSRVGLGQLLLAIGLLSLAHVQQSGPAIPDKIDTSALSAQFIRGKNIWALSTIVKISFFFAQL